jgi:hypothetical protein
MRRSDHGAVKDTDDHNLFAKFQTQHTRDDKRQFVMFERTTQTVPRKFAFQAVVALLN